MWPPQFDLRGRHLSTQEAADILRLSLSGPVWVYVTRESQADRKLRTLAGGSNSNVFHSVGSPACGAPDEWV